MAGISLMFTHPAQAETPFTIETKFPGGNVQVESIEGDVVRLAPDNRDSKPWFYWYFGVKGAAGKTLQFVFDPKNLGVYGPGLSTDGGVTWKWMGADVVKEGAFSFTFPPGANDVRFSVGMPYVSETLQRFLASYQGNPNLRLETLTKSNKGRPVPLLLLGAPNRKAQFAVGLTARHHCCEMMASYALEGVIQGILADDEQGRWLRDHVDFFVVPLADLDGVEDGDQGKNRVPHDHNRDYGDKNLYPEVAAIKERFPAWIDGRPFIFMDFHDPTLKGDVGEKIQFLDSPDPAQSENLTTFSALLERDQQGTIVYRKDMIMRFGKGYNKRDDVPPSNARGWARNLPNCLFGATLEMPYAISAGFEINADSAREFGRDIAWAMQAFLEKQSSKESQ